MTDEQSINQSVEVFHNLSGDDVTRLKELNSKIENHTGAWGIQKGGDKNVDGAIQMPWIEKDPLIYEFLDFVDDKNLLPIFDWTNWDEGSVLLASEDPDKYAEIDVATALKLIYTVTRKERLREGTLTKVFESGDLLKLVRRLVELAPSS